MHDPQSLNLYSYVRNNPVTSVDKDGHCYPFCTVIAGASVGAIFGGAAEAILEYKETGRVEWNRIGNAALGGAVAGAVLGSAGPEAGLAARVGLGISGSILGGIIDRAGDKNVSSKDVTSAENLSTDAVAGAVGPASEGIVTHEVASKAIQKAAAAAINVVIGVAAAPSANGAAGVGPKAGGTCKEGTPCSKVAGPGALHNVTPISQIPGGGL